MRPQSRTTISTRSVVMILLTTIMCVASGWTAPPRLCPSPGGTLRGVATAGATVAVVGAGAAAAVVAIDRINKDADGRRRAAAYYEPPLGSMGECVLLLVVVVVVVLDLSGVGDIARVPNLGRFVPSRVCLNPRPHCSRPLSPSRGYIYDCAFIENAPSPQNKRK
jgi:hypothetical protein